MDRFEQCLAALDGKLDEFTQVLRVDGGVELVDMAGDRTLVEVEREGDWLIFTVELAAAHVISDVGVHELHRLTLMANADADLVSKAIDGAGRLVARCCQRAVSLDRGELRAVLEALGGATPPNQRGSLPL